MHEHQLNRNVKKKKTNEKQPLRMIVLTTDKNAQREIGGKCFNDFFLQNEQHFAPAKNVNK